MLDLNKIKLLYLQGLSSMVTYWLVSKAGHPYTIDLVKAKETYEKATYWRYEIWMG